MNRSCYAATDNRRDDADAIGCAVSDDTCKFEGSFEDARSDPPCHEHAASHHCGYYRTPTYRSRESATARLAEGHTHGPSKNHSRRPADGSGGGGGETHSYGDCSHRNSND